jgi:hypothetical protein
MWRAQTAIFRTRFITKIFDRANDPMLLFGKVHDLIARKQPGASGGLGSIRVADTFLTD